MSLLFPILPKQPGFILQYCLLLPHYLISDDWEHWRLSEPQYNAENTYWMQEMGNKGPRLGP